MSSIRIDSFLGLNQIKDPSKGPFWSAAKAVNCDVRAGSIVPIYLIDLNLEAALAGADPVGNLYHLSGSTFLQWTASYEVDVVPSPLADNTSKRVYYSGYGVPQITNLSMATAGAAPYPFMSFVLGMTIGPKILDVTTSGGTGADNRAYLYTFVSPWGEEGAPSEPAEILSAIGGTVVLKKIGVTTRKYSSSPAAPVGVAADVTFIAAPVPGFLRITLTDAGYNTDFRVGDRVYYHSPTVVPGHGRYQSYLASGISSAGNGTIDVAANCWSAAGATPTAWRVLPANTFNIVAASADLPKVGQVTVYVDTTQGLRVGESVAIAGVGGMTDLNATFAVAELGTDPQRPSIIVALATVQVYTTGGIASRTAPHNTGEIKITNATFAIPTVTLTVENTANLTVGAEVFIMGIIGAYQVNGKRRISAIPTPTSITITGLAALGAYVSGGVLMLATPHELEEFGVTNVTSAGGPYPVPFAVDFTLSKAHSLVPGDLIQGQDIGGALAANNVMLVTGSTGGLNVQCTSAVGVAAYTAGGKIVKVGHQHRKRIYRTATGTTGAEYQLVDEIPGYQAHYSDALAGGGLGDVLESDDFIQPPTDLHSLVAHPHGFFLGISKNVVCASVPYKPHAWPLKYQRTLPSDGVGMAVYGSSAVVATKTIPVEFSGVTPENMTVTRIDKGAVCTSKKSVVSTGNGVAYRGLHGIHLVGYGQTHNITENLLDAELEPVATAAIGCFWKNKLIYIAGGNGTGMMLEPELDDRAVTSLDVSPYTMYAIHVSPVDGRLWVAYYNAGQKRAPLFTQSHNPDFYPFQVFKHTYWTQVIRLQRPLSYGALQLHFRWRDLSAEFKDREAMVVRNMRRGTRGGTVGADEMGGLEVAGDEFEPLYSIATNTNFPTERFMRVKVVANPDGSANGQDDTDDQVVVFDDFVVDEKPIRMDNGVKADSYQVQVEGTLQVEAVTLAETIDELDRV